MVWLSFMTGLGEVLDAEEMGFEAGVREGEEGEGGEDGGQAEDVEGGLVGRESASGGYYFKTYCVVLGLKDWREMRGLLEKFCYFGGLMDEYLRGMVGELVSGQNVGE